MPPNKRMPFPEYRPDVSDNLTQFSRNMTNVVPQGDGYGPFPGRQGGGGIPLANQCRGSFTARNSDGTLTAFRGTYNKLLIDNGTGGYPDVSFQTGGISTVAIDNGGSGGTPGTYTTVPITGGTGSGAQATFVVGAGGSVTSITVTTNGSGYKLSDAGLSAASASIGNCTGLLFHVTALSGAATQSYNLGIGSYNTLWQFAQFDNAVIAVAPGVNPQVYFLGTSTNFQDLGGNPPQANYIAIINRFVLLSGIAAQPNRLQWCDLDNINQWTPGVGQADFQDLPDGGRALNVAGFDLYGVALQDSVARLLFFIGPPITFQITKISGGDGNGLFAPYAMAVGSDRVFWLSTQGFKMVIPGTSPVPIGKEKVDRTFFNLAVAGQAPGLIQATCDPKDTRFYITFSAGVTSAPIDSGFLYDWAIERWAKIDWTNQNGSGIQIITTVGNLGTGFPNQANSMGLGIVDNANAPQLLAQLPTTNTAPATLETGEQGTPERRMLIRGFRAITDAPAITGQVSYRDTTLPPYFGTVATLKIIAGGTGGANATYTNVPLLGGSGAGLTANVTVSGGAVTALTVNNPGTSDYSLTGVGKLAIGSSSGSGGTPGTYTNVPLTGGSGFGVTANITVGGGGNVTAISVGNSNGNGYTIYDVVNFVNLTAPPALIGGCTGALFRIGGAGYVSGLADISQLTANPALIGNVTGFIADVLTLNTYNYTPAATPYPLTGEIPIGPIDARYARARVSIPANQTWTYAMGVEPDVDLTSVY